MRVLISGAGIAGPTLAWFLAKAGFRITIVEKAASLLPHGQNVDMKGAALAVIKKMGLMSQVRRFNTTEKGTQFINSKGQPFAPFPIKEGASASFTSEFEILRADLAMILHEATKDRPNVTYLFGTTIKTVIANTPSTVKVELSNGAIHEFDLLVAADGQWSKVRKQVFSPEAVNVVPQGMYSVYYTIPRLPTDNDWWNIYIALRSRVITLRPDPHGTIRAMFTYMPCNSAQETAWRDAGNSDRKTQGALLRKEFADAGWQTPRLLDAMAEAPDFYFHVIQQIKMTTWSNGRVVCLGDTAFAPSPLTGMGTSLAVTGAYVLAGELSKLAAGEHPARALEAYEKTFRPFVEESQSIPWFVPGIAHPARPWKRWVLHRFMEVLSWVVSILGSGMGDGGEGEDFKLPEYTAFGDGGEGEKKK